MAVVAAVNAGVVAVNAVAAVNAGAGLLKAAARRCCCPALHRRSAAKV